MEKSKLPLTAILLAGGESKRMGTDKAFLKLGKERLVDIVFRKLDKLFSDIIIVTDRQREFSYLPARLTGDIIKNSEKCALRGIHAGLSMANSSSCFVVGCDMPFLSLPLVHYMSRFAANFDIVAPHLGGYYQPLFAFYKKSILNCITQRLKDNRLKLTGLYPYLKVKPIREGTVKRFDPQMLSFHNVNTKESFVKAQNIYNLSESGFKYQ